MNDVDDGKFLDKLKPSLLYPSAFKSDFLGQKWVQKVKNNNLTVSSIIDGTMVSNGYGYVMTRDGEWNFWFPLWIEQEGQGVKSPPGETGVTVTVKQVAVEDAPLSGLKVVSVNQNDNDSCFKQDLFSRIICKINFEVNPNSPPYETYFEFRDNYSLRT